MRTTGRASIRLGRVLVLFGLLAVTACAGIPGTGSVQDVRQIGDVAEPAQPQAPQAGQLPDQIVRGFIQASADTNDVPYAAAKQFLTPSVQASWQSGPTPVIVLDDLVRLEVTDTSTVTLRGTQIGVLGADRSYQAVKAKPYVHEYHLTKVGGQWRITDPQSEVLIQNQQFDESFRPRSVYFLDSSGSVVVPDPRYLEGGLTSANRITRLMNLLLDGPSDRLEPGVLSQLGPTAELRSNVTTDDAGIVHVDLKGVDGEHAGRQGRAGRADRLDVVSRRPAGGDHHRRRAADRHRHQLQPVRLYTAVGGLLRPRSGVRDGPGADRPVVRRPLGRHRQPDRGPGTDVGPRRHRLVPGRRGRDVRRQRHSGGGHGRLPGQLSRPPTGARPSAGLLSRPRRCWSPTS